MLLAVYGTLKKDHPNHMFYLEGAEYKGEKTIYGYDMYSIGGAFPGVVRGTGSIKVEVYDIEPEQLARIDFLEGYLMEDHRGNLYNRVEINLEEDQNFTVYLYLFNREVKEFDLIESGDWTHQCYNYGKHTSV